MHSTDASRPPTVWIAKRPIFSASSAKGSSTSACSDGTMGAFTTYFAEPPFKTSMHCFATWIATFFWASTVLAPRCGVTMTLSRVRSGDSRGGSVSKTSSAAPATLPLLIAS